MQIPVLSQPHAERGSQCHFAAPNVLLTLTVDLHSQVTTNSAVSTTYEWDIINLSADAHPIHLHNVDFEYRGRFAITIDPLNPNSFTKTTTPVINQDLDPLFVIPCTSNPTGQCPTRKDTMLVLPGSYTRIAFSTPAQTGLYVWHW